MANKETWKVLFTFRVKPEAKAWVEAEAKRRGIKVSSLAREIFNLGVAEYAPPLPGEGGWKPVKNLIVKLPPPPGPEKR